MISFSCFIHNNKQIDDCADLSRVGHQEKAVAFIRRKTRFGKDHFELTIRFGYVELLATSGFFGSVNGSFLSPFLGSSIRELPDSITGSFQTISSNVIFTNIQKKEHSCKPKILITVLFSKIWSIVILHDYSTMLDYRLKCTFDFALMLLRSADSNKKVIYMVPERFARKFKFIVEED